MDFQILFEAIFIGVLLTVVGLLISYLYLRLVKKTNNRICLEIFNNEALIQLLFLSGFILHLLCEFTSINTWYCKYGNACKNLKD